MLYRQKSFWIIFIFWAFVHVFITPAPTILSPILGPGFLIFDVLLDNEACKNNFTVCHRFFTLSLAFDFVYYICFFFMFRKIFLKK